MLCRAASHDLPSASAHTAEPKKAAQTVQPLVGSISKRLELLGHLSNLGIDMVDELLD